MWCGREAAGGAGAVPMPPLLLSGANCCCCCASRGLRQGAGTCAPKNAAQASLQARRQSERGNTVGFDQGWGLRRGMSAKAGQRVDGQPLGSLLLVLVNRAWVHCGQSSPQHKAVATEGTTHSRAAWPGGWQRQRQQKRLVREPAGSVSLSQGA